MLCVAGGRIAASANMSAVLKSDDDSGEEEGLAQGRRQAPNAGCRGGEGDAWASVASSGVEQRLLDDLQKKGMHRYEYLPSVAATIIQLQCQSYAEKGGRN